ncbi:hypothetical protein Tco_1345766 [Tanacetum coccineum]
MEGYGTDNVTSIPTQIYSVNNLILKKGQPEGPPFIDHMLAIYKVDKPMAFKTPRTSSHTEKKDSQGKKPRAKSVHKKQSFSKHPAVSSIEATKGGSSKAPTGSKTGYSKRKKESSSAIDSNPSQPLVSKPMDPGMHKEDQKETSDPTSLGVTSEDGANPQLSTDSTAEADPGKSAPNDSLPPQKGRDEGTKNYSLDHTFSADFMDLDSPKDDPIVVVDESEGDDEVDKDEGIHSTSNVKTDDASASKPLSPRRVDKNAKKTNLNKQPESTTPLTTPIIPPIIPTITHRQSLFLQSPSKSSSQPEGEQTKEDKGKKAMSSKDNEEESTKSNSDDEKTNVVGSLAKSSKKKKLRKFDYVTESQDHAHLTEEQINAQKKIDEEAKVKATKQEGEVRRAELVDLLEPEVVSKYYNAKKGLITLKVYREDGTSEIIPDFKASDLHLDEWREVVKACPTRMGKGWKTIYEQIQTRMDYLYETEEELGIDLDKPLSEQGPLDKLNDLANKKRKHA